jgi:heme o synthase
VKKGNWNTFGEDDERKERGFAPERRPTFFACPKKVGKERAPDPTCPPPAGSLRFADVSGTGKNSLALRHLPVSFPKRPLHSGRSKREEENPSTYISRIRDLLQLARLPLGLAVALSAVAGHLLAPTSGGSPWLTGAAVLLLAAGSSALNQVQEVATDALMERTRNRPLPAGRLSKEKGTAFAAALLAGGLFLLNTAGTLAPLLGLLAVLLYNGAYTPMKKRTAFAILPGALCGALPPAIGWAAAGGDLSDPRIILLAALFFLWQIPHFWHLALRWQDDYRRAGLPVLCDLFSGGQSRRILGAWVFSLLAGGLPFLLFGLLHHPPSRALAAATLLVLALTTLREFFRQNLSLPRMALQANFFIPLFTLALLTDRIFA